MAKKLEAIAIDANNGMTYIGLVGGVGVSLAESTHTLKEVLVVPTAKEPISRLRELYQQSIDLPEKVVLSSQHMVATYRLYQKKVKKEGETQ